MGESGAGEEFETALRVADAGCGGGCQDGEDEVERPHQEVAKNGALGFVNKRSRGTGEKGDHLDHGVTTDEVRTTSNGYTSVGAINNLLASLNELANIAEPGSTICVRKQRILSPDMSHTMRDTTALAPILLQAHDTKHIMQLMLPRKVKYNVHSLVGRPVVHYNNLVTVCLLVMSVSNRVSLAALCRCDLGGAIGTADVSVEILDCFFEGGENAVCFVESGEDDRETKLGGLNRAARQRSIF